MTNEEYEKIAATIDWDTLSEGDFIWLESDPESPLYEYYKEEREKEEIESQKYIHPAFDLPFTSKDRKIKNQIIKLLDKNKIKCHDAGYKGHMWFELLKEEADIIKDISPIINNGDVKIVPPPTIGELSANFKRKISWLDDEWMSENNAIEMFWEDLDIRAIVSIQDNNLTVLIWWMPKHKLKAMAAGESAFKSIRNIYKNIFVYEQVEHVWLWQYLKTLGLIDDFDLS